MTPRWWLDPLAHVVAFVLWVVNDERFTIAAMSRLTVWVAKHGFVYKEAR